MLGLLLKDLLNLRKSGRSMLLIIVFYTIFFFSMEAGALGGVIVILVTMLTLSTFSYDDYAKWDLYALSLPITRKQLVLSKYVLGFGFVLTGAATAFIITSLVASIKGTFVFLDVVAGIAVVGVVSLYMILVLFPMIYKYGIEKARILMFLVLGVPSLVVIALVYMGFEVPSDASIESFLKKAAIVVPFILMVGAYISYQISVRIVSKKEY